MLDTQDPDVTLAEPLWLWQQTDHGRWVMQHAHNLTFHRRVDSNFFGYDVVICGDLLDPQTITEYFLKWPKLS